MRATKLSGCVGTNSRRRRNGVKLPQQTVDRFRVPVAFEWIRMFGACLGNWKTPPLPVRKDCCCKNRQNHVSTKGIVRKIFQVGWKARWFSDDEIRILPWSFDLVTDVLSRPATPGSIAAPAKPFEHSLTDERVAVSVFFPMKTRSIDHNQLSCRQYQDNAIQIELEKLQRSDLLVGMGDFRLISGIFYCRNESRGRN